MGSERSVHWAGAKPRIHTTMVAPPPILSGHGKDPAPVRSGAPTGAVFRDAVIFPTGRPRHGPHHLAFRCRPANSMNFCQSYSSTE